MQSAGNNAQFFQRSPRFVKRPRALRVVSIERRPRVFRRIGGVQRTNAKVVPHQRVDKAGAPVERISGRLAFPTAAWRSLRRIGVQTMFALATDQTEHARLVLGKLMRETVSDLWELVVHSSMINRRARGYPQKYAARPQHWSNRSAGRDHSTSAGHAVHECSFNALAKRQ